ncbi:MAG: glycosyltransferase family 4 protein [Anaerolineae bacterium]
MRILVITDEIYPDGVGGVGKSLYNECVALAKRGNLITIVVRALDSSLPEQAIINGLNIVRILGPQRHRWYYRLFPLIIIYYVTRWLRQYHDPVDIIYIHGAFYYIPVWLTRLGRKTVIVCSFYAAMDEYVRVLAQSGKYGRLKPFALLGARLMGLIEQWAFYHSDAVLARSYFSLEELRRVHPKAHVPRADNLIPLSIDTNIYSLRSRSEVRKKLYLPESRPILITVRRLDGRMGLENLIEAMKDVSTKHPDVLLLMAGKGYLRPTLETLITEHGLHDNVKLLGFVSEEDLPLYLAASDIFVLPTESLEGFGLATVEALASGIPVIGTPVGATPEILGPIEELLLTSDVTPSALAERLIYWLDHQDKLPELSIRCRHFAEELYSSTQVAERLQTLFTELVTTQKR